MKYIVTAPANGILRIDKGKYAPGDLIVLKGNFLWLGFYGLQGNPDTPIFVTNEGKVEIGNITWNGGGYAQSLDFNNAKYIEFWGSSKADMIIKGPLTTNRGSYHNVQMSNFTEGIVFHGVRIKDGGTGIVCKTDPTEDPKTWINNEPLGPFIFYDLEISNTANEAMYIGNTATYYDLTAKQQVYISPSQFDPTHKYVEPILLKNVSIRNVYVHDVQVDGIQTAAIKGLTVTNNEVTNWGIRKDWSHNGGILIGGKVEDSLVKCNYVHDGWGEMLQFYGKGSNHEIYNNYFSNNKIDGTSFRVSEGATISFRNNTIWKAGDNCVRVYSGTVRVEQNLLANPRMTSGNITDNSFIYNEKAGKFEDVNNTKITRTDKLPEGVGYQEKLCASTQPTTTTTTTTTTSTTTTTTTTVKPIPVPVAVLMSDGTKYDIKT